MKITYFNITVNEKQSSYKLGNNVFKMPSSSRRRKSNEKDLAKAAKRCKLITDYSASTR